MNGEPNRKLCIWEQWKFPAALLLAHLHRLPPTVTTIIPILMLTVAHIATPDSKYQALGKRYAVWCVRNRITRYTNRLISPTSGRYVRL